MPVAVELDILLPFKETRSCWEWASLHTRIPLPAIFAAEPCQRGREEAKNSRQGAAVFPTMAALICCENIGTVCWVSLGLCFPCLAEVAMPAPPQINFCFLRGAPPPRGVQARPSSDRPDIQAHAFLGFWAWGCPPFRVDRMGQCRGTVSTQSSIPDISVSCPLSQLPSLFGVHTVCGVGGLSDPNFQGPGSFPR